MPRQQGLQIERTLTRRKQLIRSGIRQINAFSTIYILLVSIACQLNIQRTLRQLKASQLIQLIANTQNTIKKAAAEAVKNYLNIIAIEIKKIIKKNPIDTNVYLKITVALIAIDRTKDFIIIENPIKIIIIAIPIQKIAIKTLTAIIAISIIKIRTIRISLSLILAKRIILEQLLRIRIARVLVIIVNPYARYIRRIIDLVISLISLDYYYILLAYTAFITFKRQIT